METEGTPAVTENQDEIQAVIPAMDESQHPDSDDVTPQVTDQQVDVTDSGTDGEDGDDPITELRKLWEQQEREKIAEEAKAQAKAEWEAQQRQEQQRVLALAEADKLKNSFSEAVKQAVANVRSLKLYNEEGDEVKLSEEQIQQLVVDPFQKHNLTADQVRQGTVLTQLAQSAVDSLTEAARPGFIQNASSKPLPEWLAEYAEAKASDTKYVKNLMKDIELKEKAAEARGYARGQKAPAGTPNQSGERTRSVQNFDLGTQVGLAKALSARQITEAEYLERRRKLEGYVA